MRRKLLTGADAHAAADGSISDLRYGGHSAHPQNSTLTLFDYDHS
jgi:hypothetical protein